MIGRKEIKYPWCTAGAVPWPSCRYLPFPNLEACATGYGGLTFFVPYSLAPSICEPKPAGPKDRRILKFSAGRRTAHKSVNFMADELMFSGNFPGCPG